MLLVQSQEKTWNPIQKITKAEQGLYVDQIVEHSSSKYEALSSKSSTTKKRNEEKRKVFAFHKVSKVLLIQKVPWATLLLSMHWSILNATKGFLKFRTKQGIIKH
jgi:hypothetical protein